LLSGWGDKRYGVEVASTIAAKNHVSRPEVLDRETKGVKLDWTTIIATELANRKQVTNNGRNDKYVV